MTRSPESEWFWDHYEEAAQQIVDLLGGDGISLAGKEVADVGCGDGITDLGVVEKAAPLRLTGFDINLTDTQYLRRRAVEEGLSGELPASLEFRASTPTQIPAEDDSFDAVLTWSAFEHVREPIAVLREVRRILRPDGVFLLQLWPFYYSDRGSHLWHWFDEPFPHLMHDVEELAAAMRSENGDDRLHADNMIREYRNLNRITVDELQQAMLAAGLGVRKLELLTNPVHIPDQLMRFPLSKLGVSGVKLLATPFA